MVLEQIVAGMLCALPQGNSNEAILVAQKREPQIERENSLPEASPEYFTYHDSFGTFVAPLAEERRGEIGLFGETFAYRLVMVDTPLSEHPSFPRHSVHALLRSDSENVIVVRNKSMQFYLEDLWNDFKADSAEMERLIANPDELMKLETRDFYGTLAGIIGYKQIRDFVINDDFRGFSQKVRETTLKTFIIQNLVLLQLYDEDSYPVNLDIDKNWRRRAVSLARMEYQKLALLQHSREVGLISLFKDFFYPGENAWKLSSDEIFGMIIQMDYVPYRVESIRRKALQLIDASQEKISQYVAEIRSNFFRGSSLNYFLNSRWEAAEKRRIEDQVNELMGH